MLVRPRTPADRAACLALLDVVHELDGYPPWLGPGLVPFLESPDALAAWVAVGDGEVVGHVALHGSGPRAAIDRACDATGLPADRLAVVARLLVSPRYRRRGVGRSLLMAASAEATGRGLRPVLDVARQFTGAVALYESCGWTCAGPVTFDFGDGSTLESHVYVGPAPLT